MNRPVLARRLAIATDVIALLLLVSGGLFQVPHFSEVISLYPWLVFAWPAAALVGVLVALGSIVLGRSSVATVVIAMFGLLVNTGWLAMCLVVGSAMHGYING